MVVVLVRIEDMLRRGGVPVELGNFILPNQWNIITEAILKVHTDANFWACCCEVTVCVLFAFPCIFCCHPCFAESMIQGNLSSKLAELNHALFNDFPVMTLSDNCVMFNAGYLSPVEQVYFDRTNTGDYRSQNDIPVATTAVRGPAAYQDQSGYVAINPVVTAQPTIVRTMAVTVPPNAGPGSVLTVTAPNGNVLSVVVPANSGPGQDLIIQY